MNLSVASANPSPSIPIGVAVYSTLSTFGYRGVPGCEARAQTLVEAVKEIRDNGTDLTSLPTCEPEAPNPNLVAAVAAIGVYSPSRQQEIAYSLAARLRPTR